VAQVSRRIAERLIRDYPKKVSQLGGIDADVAEACALAHDLGHPPFGHVAEEQLDELVSAKGMRGQDPDGFEGNAQSFRIITRLALRGFQYDGLNLTRATLNGTLKYPWFRARGQRPKTAAARRRFDNKRDKWGAYGSEAEIFYWVREGAPNSDAQSIEAQIMDWSDDITYAIHDVGDFFKVGLIPLDRIASIDRTERDQFYEKVFAQPNFLRNVGFTKQELTSAFDDLLKYLPIRERYTGTKEHRSALRVTAAGMIGECVKGVELSVPQSQIVIPKKNRKEISMLKQLTLQYVIMNPSLTTKQVGQRKIIRQLFGFFHDAAVERNDLDTFPSAYRQLIESARNDRERTRLVADMIGGMTEQQAISIHRKLTGTNLGSLLDSASR
jgi:dGTPase